MNSQLQSIKYPHCRSELATLMNLRFKKISAGFQAAPAGANLTVLDAEARGCQRSICSRAHRVPDQVTCVVKQFKSVPHSKVHAE